MNCLVTAGPTIEPLDQVRRLTNFSTGRLGTELAAHLLICGHSVTLLRGATSTFHESVPSVRIHDFLTLRDLQSLLIGLASESTPFDAVFHAAAVGDYYFGRVYRRDAANQPVDLESNTKIETKSGPLYAELLPTPKIIDRMRSWFFNAYLVGWKYEVDGSRTESIKRARDQLTRTQTDACVINGPAYGQGFGVLESDRKDVRSVVHQHAPDKPALFKLLSDSLENRHRKG